MKFVCNTFRRLSRFSWKKVKAEDVCWKKRVKSEDVVCFDLVTEAIKETLFAGYGAVYRRIAFYCRFAGEPFILVFLVLEDNEINHRKHCWRSEPFNLVFLVLEDDEITTRKNCWRSEFTDEEDHSGAVGAAGNATFL